ncbi:hypothetical protein [Bacterioplanoides pacificum]|uniref:Lipoprotein n=1 Tax=Bacterioplanoides pacificum TaxID=1171596 RepID=A0ABV7VXD2_9GAMM
MKLTTPLRALTATSLITLSACGGSSGSGDNSTRDDDSAAGGSSPTLLTDNSWSAGQDRILGLSYGGTKDKPIISMLKAKPVTGQDGDAFSFQSVIYPQTEFNETHAIDNLNDRQDYQEFDIIDGYVIACQDGNNSTGYEQATKLHIWQRDTPDKVATLQLRDIGNNFVLRDCNSLDAHFTQGNSTAMAAQVYVVGYSEPVGTGYGGDRLVRVEMTIDTTKAIIDDGAISFSSGSKQAAAQSLYQANPGDSLDAVAAHWNDVYFFRYDDNDAYNSLYYLNAAPNNSTPVVVSQSVNDVFAGMDQRMSVKDMTLVKGVNNHDLIYLVSDDDVPGIAVAGYRPFVNVPALELAKTSDTLAQRCSDAITANPKNGRGQKMWCYDSTDAGKIIELPAPVYP